MATAAIDAGQEGVAAVAASEAIDLARAQRLQPVERLAEAVQALIALSGDPDGHYVRTVVRSIEALEGLGRPGEAAIALGILARTHESLGDIGAAIRTLGRAQPLAKAAGRLGLQSRLQQRAERLAAGG